MKKAHKSLSRIILSLARASRQVLVSQGILGNVVPSFYAALEKRPWEEVVMMLSPPRACGAPRGEAASAAQGRRWPMADGARTPPADGLAEGGAAGRAEAVDGLSRPASAAPVGAPQRRGRRWDRDVVQLRVATKHGCLVLPDVGPSHLKPFNIHIKHKYMYVHIFCLR